MSEVDEKRLAVVVRAMNRGKNPYKDDDVPLVYRRALAALDAHDAAEARAGITDEIVEGAAQAAWESRTGLLPWKHVSPDVRAVCLRDARIALEHAAPLLARRAPMPEVVTEPMLRAAIDETRAHTVAWQRAENDRRDVETMRGDAARLALTAALAAAPRDPQPAEPVSIGMPDKNFPHELSPDGADTRHAADRDLLDHMKVDLVECDGRRVMTPPPDSALAALSRRVEALEAAATGKACIAPAWNYGEGYSTPGGKVDIAPKVRT